MPIRQQGCARLWTNDKAFCWPVSYKTCPFPPWAGITLAKERLHLLARQNVTAHFFISPNISLSQGAKPLKGQPEWLVVDRNAIKVKKGSASLHVNYCLFYMRTTGAGMRQAQAFLTSIILASNIFDRLWSHVAFQIKSNPEVVF